MRVRGWNHEVEPRAASWCFFSIDAGVQLDIRDHDQEAVEAQLRAALELPLDATSLLDIALAAIVPAFALGFVGVGGFDMVDVAERDARAGGVVRGRGLFRP